MSTSVVLGLFTSVSIATIVGILAAAVWARSRSNREDVEPTDLETVEEGSGSLFTDADFSSLADTDHAEALVDAHADSH
jgi:hypothetical protein